MHTHGPIGRLGAVWVNTTIPGRGNVHRPGPRPQALSAT
jgi:hypothetical protein